MSIGVPIPIISWEINKNTLFVKILKPFLTYNETKYVKVSLSFYNHITTSPFPSMRADKTGGVHTIGLFAELRPTQEVAQSMWVDRKK